MQGDRVARGANRCKQGDRAIITRCGNRAYEGLIVRVVEPFETAAFDWVVEFLGRPIEGRDLYTRESGTFTHAPVFDWNLTPLPDLECEGLQTDEIPVPVAFQTHEEFPTSI